MNHILTNGPYNFLALSTTSKSANVTDTTTVEDNEASLQVTEKPSNKSEETNKLHPSNAPIVQSRILPDLESTIALHSDEFKVSNRQIQHLTWININNFFIKIGYYSSTSPLRLIQS